MFDDDEEEVKQAAYCLFPMARNSDSRSALISYPDAISRIVDRLHQSSDYDSQVAHWCSPLVKLPTSWSKGNYWIKRFELIDQAA